VPVLFDQDQDIIHGMEHLSRPRDTLVVLSVNDMESPVINFRVSIDIEYLSIYIVFKFLCSCFKVSTCRHYGKTTTLL
jgi:hypothetical protein